MDSEPGYGEKDRDVNDLPMAFAVAPSVELSPASRIRIAVAPLCLRVLSLLLRGVVLLSSLAIKRPRTAIVTACLIVLLILIPVMRGSATDITPGASAANADDNTSGRPASSDTAAAPAAAKLAHSIVSLNDEPPVEILPSPTADEQLFLAQLLAWQHDRWPQTSNVPWARAELPRIRSQAAKIFAHVREGGDPDLSRAYKDLIDLADAHVDLLVSLDRIATGTIERARQETTAAGTNAASNGVAAAGVMSQAGYSGSDSALAGAALGIINYAMEADAKAKARTTANDQATQDVIRAWERRKEDTVAAAQNATERFLARRGLPRTAAGWTTAAEKAQLAQLSTGGDERAYAPLFASISARSPQNPFPPADSVIRPIMLAVNDQTLSAAERTLAAAKWIPGGEVYDQYRGYCLLGTAISISKIVDHDVSATHGPRYGSRHPLALRGARLWQAIGRYCGDESGVYRACQMDCLAVAGALAEARDLSIEIWPVQKNEPAYIRNVTCLMCANGEMDSALEWFTCAITRQAGSQSWGRNDPDLASLRAARADDVNKLLTPNFSWWINFGLMNDDVVLKNTSPFALSAITLSVDVTSGGKRWTPKLTTERIEPGQIYTWSSVFSIPGNKTDAAGATLLCNESR